MIVACRGIVTYWELPQKGCIALEPMFYARLISDIITDGEWLYLK